MKEKEIKEMFKKHAQRNPSKYYPVEFLKSKGFIRRKCVKCGNFFWTLESEREVCGDPQCIGKYEFIGKENALHKMDFISVWKIFSKIFKKLGYEVVSRYPVVARWRDDIDFVMASIAAFQPYVVNGVVEPPAPTLVIPQFCLRFNDIDNVGFTGRHYTGFVMIGQHAFVNKEEYDKEKYLADIHYWLTNGMKVREEEIIYHEDAWAGGGNLGPSMEFFVRGLEIGNQVYMQYDIRSGDIKEIDIAVLDMGMGQERVAWLTHGSATSYEVVFPPVMKYLYSSTGIKYDKEIWEKFLPYAGLLNVDEAENLEKIWDDISKKIKIDTKILRTQIENIASLYSIAEHMRTLLLAISDGALPSNVGGGYNLRVIARRSFDLIEKHGFSLDIHTLLEKHARYLREQYPELEENLENVKKILDMEYKKYLKSRENAKHIIAKYSKKKIEEKDLLILYQSHGISPYMLQQAGVIERVPSTFYGKLSQQSSTYIKDHLDDKEEKSKVFSLDLKDIPETQILYWRDWKITSFEAKILKIIDNKDNQYIILDRTAFYPKSGGQLYDTGWIIGNNGEKLRVINVVRRDKYVVHVVDKSHRQEEAFTLKEGMKIRGEVDFERRKRLTQHHSGAHILNLACRIVLGNHVWQAGAEKTPEKGRLDITHYELPSFEEIRRIERIANEIISKDLEVEKYVMERNKAEKKFGFRIYQGGAPPGKYLRIVKIGDDVEACGGTHLNRTGEAMCLKITNVSKIQDGMVRFEYKCGLEAIEYIQRCEDILYKSSSVFSVPYSKLPETCQRFFMEWKKQRKELEILRKEVFKNKIKEGIREIKGKKIAFIYDPNVEIKDILPLISNMEVDGVVIEQEKGKIIVSPHHNAHDLAFLLFPSSTVKGKGKIVFIKENN